MSKEVIGITEYVLYHHGIKGMKWGIRRYQRKDGTLTTAGKKRYSEDSSEPNKSKHRSKLEAKYREQGMSQKQAEFAASRRIKTEKIIAVTAGMTVAAATAYVVNKNVKERADGIIKSGTTLQRITSTPDENLDRAFYAAYKNVDNTKYKGMYGKQLTALGDNAYKVTLNANQDIKIASRKKAADVFADLYKNDPEFRESFIKSNNLLKRGNPNVLATKIHRIASGDMTDKQLKKQGYDAFNIGLVNHNPNGSAVSKKFYDRLKSMGYDAVMDINDQKYSGYDAKKPVIVFNSKNKVSLSEAKKLTNEQIVSSINKTYRRVIGKEIAKQGSITAGVLLAGSFGTMTVNTVQINNYRKEHPNTNMTDSEIIESLGLQGR